MREYAGQRNGVVLAHNIEGLLVVPVKPTILSCGIFHNVSCLGIDMQKIESGQEPGLKFFQIDTMKIREGQKTVSTLRGM